MKRISYLLLCLTLIGMAGCGYTLVGQGSLPKHIKTVAIPVFENTTLEKGVEDVLTKAVIDVYISGGKVRLVSEGEADALLRGKIRSYNAREAVTYNDSNEVSSYRLTVTLDLELQDLTRNEVFWKTENLSGNVTFDGGPDVDVTTQQGNEEKALKTVAKDLAERIWALSTEGF